MARSWCRIFWSARSRSLAGLGERQRSEYARLEAHARSLERLAATQEKTYRELEGYAWDPKASERGLDAPLKEDDHGPDALRYAVMAMRRFWRSWIALPSVAEEAA